MRSAREVKADRMLEDAVRAWDDGLTVFTAVLVTVDGLTSGSVRGWAEMVEAIESVGWKLDQWSVSSVMNGRASVMQAAPIFRRA